MSSPLRIFHIEPLPDWIRGIYVGAVAEPSFDLTWLAHLDDDAIPSAVRGANVLVTGKRRITERTIREAGSELRLIQIVGRAPWAVDFQAARAAGVPVSFLPHTGAISVAEHTMALMSGLTRRLVQGHIGTVGASYRELGIEPIRTDERTIAFNWLKIPDIRELYGKTLGLVGLGDIGMEVVRRARAFDMQVIYTKRRALPREHEEMLGVRFALFDDLFAQSDVVSLHAPHTEATEGMVDAGALALMQNGAMLVNTSRGGLVNEDALVAALRDRQIGGAALDVFVDEPLPAGHPFTSLDNVLLSPHVGGATGGGQRGVVAQVAANLERVARDETPHHLADAI